MNIDDPAYKYANTQGGGGIIPPCTGLTTDALPEVQKPVSAENSHTGVSPRNAQSANKTTCNINSDKKIMKKVLAIISLLFLVLNGNAQESLDTIKSFRLSEVVVKAERIIHKGDHDVLYLSNDNKKFGTNALDAVSSS